MTGTILTGITIPFLGTSLGAALVFFLKKQISGSLQKILTGFAAGVSRTAALALAIGIAIQNFPEGAIVSMPLLAEGMPKSRTFWMGVLSGAVEPVAAAVTILAASAVVPVLPYLLAFAAGAMMYVVVEELIPEMSEGSHSNLGTIAFSLGFVLMMILDVALG